MIALLGASGRIGRPLAELLVARGVDARALVRDPGAAALPVPAVRADLDDPASIRAGLNGCDRLFLLTPHGPDQDVREAAAVRAAVEAGVGGIVKLSGGAASLSPNGPTPTATGHWRTEGLIEDSGLAFAHLRPPFLMQNLLGTIAPLVRRAGVVAGPFADEPIAMVDVHDVAACAAALLTTAELGAAAWAPTGPRPVTFREIAELLDARLLRLPLRVTGAALRRRGEDPWEVEHAVAMAGYLRTGAAGPPTDAVRRLTGAAPTGIETFLTVHRDAFAPTRRRATSIGSVRGRPSEHDRKASS